MKQTSRAVSAAQPPPLPALTQLYPIAPHYFRVFFANGGYAHRATIQLRASGGATKRRHYVPGQAPAWKNPNRTVMTTQPKPDVQFRHHDRGASCEGQSSR